MEWSEIEILECYIVFKYHQFMFDDEKKQIENIIRGQEIETDGSCHENKRITDN
jgi:hypothetical protein